MTPEPDVESFQRLYAAHVDPVLGYALRRVVTPADAADIVAETFLVAWRRRADVPAGPTRPGRWPSSGRRTARSSS